MARNLHTTLAMRDPFASDVFRRDPYGVYRSLRDAHPVYEVTRAAGPEFVLTRHADVETALCDERFSVNRLRADSFREQAEDLPPDLRPEGQRATLLNVDPPDHTRLRGLVSRAFTPRRVEALAPAIERRAAELLDEVDPGRPWDLLAGFAAPLPARVIADLLGVPEADHARFRDWSERMLRTLVGAPPDLAGFRRARNELDAYLRSIVEARRRQPEDDLISALVIARDADDALADDELLATCVLLLVAGHETTANLIANAVWLLLSEEGRLARFRAAPEPALEELLRFESPIQAVARVTTAEVELSGARLPPGALVSAMLGAANRDPAVFPEPDRLDPSRSPNPHLAFGKGVHFCLGASLARLEARIALDALFARFPDLALLDPAPAWRRSLLLRGLERLRTTVAR